MTAVIAHIKKLIVQAKSTKTSTRAVLVRAEPRYQRLQRAFAHNPSNGVTLVVEATRNEKAPEAAPAIQTLREVIKYVTPATPLTLEGSWRAEAARARDRRAYRGEIGSRAA